MLYAFDSKYLLKYFPDTQSEQNNTVIKMNYPISVTILKI